MREDDTFEGFVVLPTSEGISLLRGGCVGRLAGITGRRPPPSATAEELGRTARVVS